MSTKNIYLIRHTEVYNPNNFCYGQSEMPLVENFTIQFDWIKERLQLNETTAFFSGPLRRCTKLATYLSEDNFKIDSRISDINFGNWEMKEWNAIPLKEVNAWREDFVNYKIKKGESFLELYDRVIDFYEKITQQSNFDGDVLIVTHAAVIRAVISYILDFPLENIFNLQIDTNSITKLTYDTELATSSIAYLNLTAQHLKIEARENTTEF